MCQSDVQQLLSGPNFEGTWTKLGARLPLFLDFLLAVGAIVATYAYENSPEKLLDWKSLEHRCMNEFVFVCLKVCLFTLSVCDKREPPRFFCTATLGRLSEFFWIAYLKVVCAPILIKSMIRYHMVSEPPVFRIRDLTLFAIC